MKHEDKKKIIQSHQLAGGIFRQKPVSESFLQYSDNGVLDENKTNVYTPLDTKHTEYAPLLALLEFSPASNCKMTYLYILPVYPNL
jgi:hypothetical protein